MQSTAACRLRGAVAATAEEELIGHLVDRHEHILNPRRGKCRRRIRLNGTSHTAIKSRLWAVRPGSRRAGRSVNRENSPTRSDAGPRGYPKKSAYWGTSVPGTETRH